MAERELLVEIIGGGVSGDAGTYGEGTYGAVDGVYGQRAGEPTFTDEEYLVLPPPGWNPLREAWVWRQGDLENLEMVVVPKATPYDAITTTGLRAAQVVLRNVDIGPAVPAEYAFPCKWTTSAALVQPPGPWTYRANPGVVTPPAPAQGEIEAAGLHFYSAASGGKPRFQHNVSYYNDSLVNEEALVKALLTPGNVLSYESDGSDAFKVVGSFPHDAEDYLEVWLDGDRGVEWQYPTGGEIDLVDFFQPEPTDPPTTTIFVPAADMATVVAGRYQLTLHCLYWSDRGASFEVYDGQHVIVEESGTG